MIAKAKREHAHKKTTRRWVANAVFLHQWLCYRIASIWGLTWDLITLHLLLGCMYAPHQVWNKISHLICNTNECNDNNRADDNRTVHRRRSLFLFLFRISFFRHNYYEYTFNFAAFPSSLPLKISSVRSFPVVERMHTLSSDIRRASHLIAATRFLLFLCVASFVSVTSVS